MNPPAVPMKKITGRILQREHGQTLLMFVLFMVVLFVFVGLGVDLGFAYITKARLSKAVDSAALTGARSIGQGTISASAIAKSAFAANYGTSGRDVSPPVPSVVFSNDAANNLLLDVSATSVINTFFIRVLPAWSRLTVGSASEALRAKIVLSLVLDRSGSMSRNGGSAALPGAVANFIDLFYENYDRASMSSFSYGARTDVLMRPDFKSPITTAAKALAFDGWTASERGLTNALVQNNSVSIASGEKVIKVVVFFSDGMANTFYYPTLNCGPQDIAQDLSFWDPVTGNGASGCTVPSPFTSINGGLVTPTCVGMNNEAEDRAERIAFLARAAGNIVYAIGMGDPNDPGECGGAFRALNPDFLKNLANTPDSLTHDGTQPEGDYAIAADSSHLDQVFQTIGSKILLRLTR